MRTLAAVTTAALFATGLASAQMKVPQPAPPAPPVQIAPPVPQEQPLPPLESARRIERDEAIKLVKEKKAVFVDVRGKESYDAGHIAGAISIPGTDLISRLKELPPGRMIITYCA
jgi:3-mercaptopyruvate sulfurtransferase SseA